MTVRQSPRVPWQVWFALMWASIALGVVAVVGDYVGWWQDLGLVLAFLSLALSIAFGGLSATERTVQTIREDLAGMADDLSTIKVVLERIARHLGA